MAREAERNAFSKACSYLNYNPLSHWTAHLAAFGAGLVYVGLLVVLWLFADLMVSHGRLPTYYDVPAHDQERFLKEWPALTADDEAALTERMNRLEQLGFDEARSREIALQPPSPDMPPADLDALWRVHLARIIHDDLHAPEEKLKPLLAPANYHEVDHGALSLLVRSHLHGDYLLPPVLAWVMRWNPWLWNAEPHSLFLSHLTGLLLVAIALASLGVLLGMLMRRAAALAAIGAATRFRRAVYHHTFRLGTLAIRALGPTEAVTVFTRHIEAVHDALYARLTVYFREAIKFVLLLAFALVVQFWLALAFLLFAALVWMIGGRIAAYFNRQARAATTRAAERLTIIRESLMLMRLVKSYLMEQFNQSRVERQLVAYAHVQLVRHRSESISRPIMVGLGFLCALVLLYVAGLIVLSGGLGVAGMAVLATALVSLYYPVEHWLASRRIIRRGQESALQLFKFLERRGEVAQVVGAEFLPPLAERIELDNVSLRDPGTGRMLLEEVSLSIPAGKRVGVIAADDMEKYALVYLIPRLLDPTAGEVRMDKHNLRWVTLDSLRAQVGIVLQHNLVFHDSVANNIGCGDPAYTLPRIIEAAKVAHAHHFIQKLPQGYDTPIGELGHTLSVSEQFRIALARAILRDPAVLIIEEPEKALDEDSKSLLDDTMTRILPGRTAIFLPHRISTIRGCDRLFLLNKGRLAATGDHKELLGHNPLYRHLHYLEFNEMDEQV